jgi:DNA (cytosine-5)-methyltransferase 1
MIASQAPTRESSASSTGYISLGQITGDVRPGVARAEGAGGVHLDLFSGIGGFSIAAEAAGFRTVAFCEIDPEASLMLTEFWPGVPNLVDVKKLTLETYDLERPELITGGVPCQPASALGLMRGTADERWLWPDAIRIVREFRPRFAVFENPPALLGLEDGAAWNGIVSELVALGYDLWWDVFPAAAFGAGHLRERVLLVCIADTDSERWKEGRLGILGGEAEARREVEPMRQSAEDDRETTAPNANSEGLQGHAGNGANGEGRPRERRPVAPADLRGRVASADWWHEARTGVPVLADGLPSRLVEAVSRCAGNSVVPQALMPVMLALASVRLGGGGGVLVGRMTPPTEAKCNDQDSR